MYRCTALGSRWFRIHYKQIETQKTKKLHIYETQPANRTRQPCRQGAGDLRCRVTRLGRLLRGGRVIPISDRTIARTRCMRGPRCVRRRALPATSFSGFALSNPTTGLLRPPGRLWAHTARRTPRDSGYHAEKHKPVFLNTLNQTLVRGWIWAFQTKSYLMVQESTASDKVLLFFLK